MPPRIVILCGPTATGKTKLGVALAKALDGEVVSADSMQVYRDMAIGTARPTAEEMEGVPHHMLAVADPAEPYSVARYVAEAVPIVDDILSRGKVPLIVGGTGLYIDALRRGQTFSAHRPDSGLRAQLRARAEAEGLAPLYEELKTDPNVDQNFLRYREAMSKKVKKDHSRSGLGSQEVEGQGTTTHETGSHKVPSSNKKQKQS